MSSIANRGIPLQYALGSAPFSWGDVMNSLCWQCWTWMSNNEHSANISETGSLESILIAIQQHAWCSRVYHLLVSNWYTCIHYTCRSTHLPSVLFSLPAMELSDISTIVDNYISGEEEIPQGFGSYILHSEGPSLNSSWILTFQSSQLF